jgi:hypothetical protein
MLNTEQLLTLQQAAERLPNRPNQSTVWRWCRKGLNGVHLEYRRLGRAIYTSMDALDRFTLALAQADLRSEPEAVAIPKHAKPCQRDTAARANEEAKRSLQAAGF